MPDNFLNESQDKELEPGSIKEGSEFLNSNKANRLIGVTIFKRKMETADGIVEETFFQCMVYAMNEKILVFVFGVVFVVVMLFIAHSTPEPTSFQYFVFRTVLSASIAGIAVFIPGLLDITIKNWLKASGAFAIFVFVYYVNPAGLADLINSSSANPTEQ